jgi:predicted PurR-regulated permease PerM
MATELTAPGTPRVAGHRRPDTPGPRGRVWRYWQQQPPPWLARAALTVTAVVVAVLFAVDLLGHLRGLLVLVLISFFLSCALEAPVSRLVRRGWRRSRATGLVFLGVLLGIGVFLWLMGQLLVRQVTSLVDGLPEFTRDAANLVDERFDTELSNSDVTAQLTGPDSPVASLGGQLAGDVVGVGASVLGLLFQALTVGLFTYYFTVDGHRLRQWLCSFLPADRQRELVRLSDVAVDRTAAYINYRIVLAMLSALVHTAAFQAIGLPNSVALGLWVGVISQFVPTVGTYIAGVLPILVAIPEGLRPSLIVLAFIVVYQQVENYLVSPRLGQRTLNIHPAVGFGAVIAGTAILGAVGAILALPVVAIVQSFAGAYVHRHDVIDEALLVLDQDQSRPTSAAVPPVRSSSSS